MKELKTEINIAAKPADVWETLSDLSSWPSWNPIVNQVEGDFKVGSNVNFVMANDQGKDSQKYKAVITKIDDKSQFIYNASMMAKFMFSVDRIIDLQPSEDGTILRQREVYSGLMVPLFWKKLQSSALPMLESMNEALKKKVENN